MGNSIAVIPGVASENGDSKRTTYFVSWNDRVHKSFFTEAEADVFILSLPRNCDPRKSKMHLGPGGFISMEDL